MTRIAVLLAAVVVLLLVGAPSLLDRVSKLRDRVPALFELHRTADAQSAAQISRSEFAGLAPGLTPGLLRARVGAPDHTSTARLEGLRIECWYYGVADTAGAYQLCFSNGRLKSKLRFGRVAA